MFTKAESVTILLLLVLLTAIAVPSLSEFQGDMRNAATQGALAMLRSSIEQAHREIQLREKSGTPSYPTVAELTANAFDASHPALTGGRIVEMGSIPRNPWAGAHPVNVCDCVDEFSRKPTQSACGWCYHPQSGAIWANSNRNGLKATENSF